MTDQEYKDCLDAIRDGALFLAIGFMTVVGILTVIYLL